MAPIVSTLVVGRPPEDVFAHATTDLSRFHEWQKGVVSGRMEDGRAPAVGSKCVDQTDPHGRAAHNVGDHPDRPAQELGG